MDLLEIMRRRRSVRLYTEEGVSEQKIIAIVQAGLMSASGKSIRPWEFIVIRNQKTLREMAGCRITGAQMLASANCAIVVLGDEEKTDVWIEDCCVAMANMHLMADSVGVGSCWIQGRLREASTGRSTEEFLRELLEFPMKYRLEAILSLGTPRMHPEPHDLEKLPTEKVHMEIFGSEP